MAWTPRTWWRTASCEPQVPARSWSCPGILFRKPLYCKAEVERTTWGMRDKEALAQDSPGRGGGSCVTSLGEGVGCLEVDAAGTASCFASLGGVGSSRARWTPGSELWVSSPPAQPESRRSCSVAVMYINLNAALVGDVSCLLWTSETPLSPAVSFPVGAWLLLALDSQCCTKPLRNLQGAGLGAS